MSPFSAICFGFAILLVVHGNVSDAGRIARSPQFGAGFSQAQANAQAGGFGFGRPQYYQPAFGPQGPYRPGFGGAGYGGGFGGGGFGGPRPPFGQGGSISISKSISISRGPGGSQSSAQSAAGK